VQSLDPLKHLTSAELLDILKISSIFSLLLSLVLLYIIFFRRCSAQVVVVVVVVCSVLNA
jgi:hypothetical protein